MIARVRDPEATRTAILAAAEEVFLEKGFGNTAMSEIARRAGVTKSLLHHHFGSKENLWAEVKQRRFQNYAEIQMAMIKDADGTSDLLRESFEFYFRFLQRNPELVKIMAWVFLEQDASDTVCFKMDDELFKIGTARLKEAQERGELRSDVDPGSILFTFIGISQHWFQDRKHMLKHLGGSVPDEVVDERYLRDVMKIFFEGVVPRD